MKRLRRTKEQIWRDILGAILFNRLHIKFTPLMQKANIEGSKLRIIHIPYLMKQGWVNRPTFREYHLTQEGIEQYIQFRIKEPR